MTDIGQLDLNLLRTLDVLLAEHNVTRAAERLHLSQPAVSVHLGHLREFFGDPLLLPGPRGMHPTARADALREPLHAALAAMQAAVAPVAAFDPAQAQHTWQIAAADYAETTVILPALASLRQAAPHTRLAVRTLDTERVARQLDQGELDLACHVHEAVPPHMHSRTLFTERYVLAGRAGHPRLRRRPGVAQFAALEHVIVSPDGGGFAGVTDTTLAACGLQRRVVLSVPHFLFVREALARTDLVAMLPARLARACPELRVVEAPVAVPGFSLAMFWPERVHRDPAHQWLRAQLAGSVPGTQTGKSR